MSALAAPARSSVAATAKLPRRSCEASSTTCRAARRDPRRRAPRSRTDRSAPASQSGYRSHWRAARSAAAAPASHPARWIHWGADKAGSVRPIGRKPAPPRMSRARKPRPERSAERRSSSAQRGKRASGITFSTCVVGAGMFQNMRNTVPPTRITTTSATTIKRKRPIFIVPGTGDGGSAIREASWRYARLRP